MRVRAISVAWNCLPAEVSPFVSSEQTSVTPGVEYDVYALSVYKRVVFVLIVDDTQAPTFVPLYLFEKCTTDIPADWMCNATRDSDVDLVIGPEFIARDLDAYGRMIDQEADSIAIFWERIEQLKQRDQE